MLDLFSIITNIIVPLHHTGDLRKWAIVEEKRERIGRKRGKKEMWLSAKFWGEGIVNNSHVMGMAQGLAPRDKLATVGGYSRLQRCNLDWGYI